jgi:hypothetical protein
MGAPLRNGLPEVYRAVIPTLRGPGQRSRWVMSLALYLDDSNTHSTAPVVVLAGWLSTIEAWTEFEVEARAIYNDAKIPYLHGKLFHQNRRQFDGWENSRKRDFIERLFSVARPKIGCGYAFATDKGTYDARRKELGVNHRMPALGFCLWGIVDILAKDQVIQDMVRAEGVTISILLEAGNRNNDRLKEWVDRIRAQRKIEWLKPVSYVIKESPASNVADFLAFYSSLKMRPGPKAHLAPDWHSLAFNGLRIEERRATSFDV